MVTPDTVRPALFVALPGVIHSRSKSQDAGADPSLKHASQNFAADLGRVSGKPAELLIHVAAAKGEVVLIGALGQSPVIDRLVTEGKLVADDLQGRWEADRQVVLQRRSRASTGRW